MPVDLQQHAKRAAGVLVVVDNQNSELRSNRFHFCRLRSAPLCGGFCNRQPHGELAALTCALALHVHGAAVELDQAPHEREADAKSAV